MVHQIEDPKTEVQSFPQKYGPFQGRDLPVGTAPLYIGRDAQQCVLVIDDDQASRIHCSLTVLPGGQLQLEDLQSTNGTFVNDRKISQPTIISTGDRVRIGKLLFRFQFAQDHDNQSQLRNDASFRVLSVPQRSFPTSG